MLHWSLRPAAFFLSAAALLACSDPDAGTGSGPDDSGDGAEDTGDVGALDSGDGSGATQDAGDGSGEATGSPGNECESDDECEERVCIDVVVGAEQGICSRYCSDDADCDDGFDCVYILNSGGDAVQVCLPTDLCVDVDGDSYGVGPGCAGSDCDDEIDSSNPVADELCDNIDNDCDLDVDDNTINENDDCDTGAMGVCATGRIACRDGIEECVAAATPTEEVCDRLDNDCDGATDDGEDGQPLSRVCYDGAEGTLGIGPCVAGTQTCADGGFTGCLRQVVPGEEVCDGVDNDCNGTVDDDFTTQDYWPDIDGDGFGAAGSIAVQACSTPAGYADNDDDCNDRDELIFGSAAEVPGDGVDQNCDRADICWVDGDDDGYHAGELAAADAELGCDADGLGDASTLEGDCDDDASAIHPAADELVGDEIDQDCNGRELCYVDADNDGFRTDVTVVSLNPSCGNNGEAQDFEPSDDCDDETAAINPGATEVCDDVDNDCDGMTDNGGDGGRFWVDADDDGFGDRDAVPISDCTAPAGYSTNDGDCDDDADAVNPDAAEVVGDALDNDCDGVEECFVDLDGDGWRASPTATVKSADRDCIDAGEGGATTPVGDCDDALSVRNNGATEICDRIDNDCDSLVDGDDPDFGGGNGSFWPDVDGDTFGDRTEAPVVTCSPPSGWVTNGRDCNDSSGSINPDAVEGIADGIDQNCDGGELCFADLDDDGYYPDGVTAVSLDLDCTDAREADNEALPGDCNDGVELIHPGAEEIVGDEVDEDCNGGEICRLDNDGDGWRGDPAATVVSADRFCNGPREATAAAGTGDCNEANAAIYPTAVEVAGDEVDQNCDGGELCYANIDADAYRTNEFVTSVDIVCTDAGEAISAIPTLDCNDAIGAINPAATEVCDGLDNDCDELVDGDDPQIPDVDGDTVDACTDCDDNNSAITNVLTVTGGGVGTVIEGDIFGDGIKQVQAIVSGAIVISDVNVVVNITHGWDSDVAIRLRGPDGTAVTLSNRRGGNGNNYTGTVFDDEATRTIASGVAPFAGSYRPETPLTAFDGKSTAGTWTLELQDYISDEDGVLLGWEMRFGLSCQ